MTTAFLQYVKEIIPESNIACNEPMSKHTTFRVGGEADCYITIENEEQLSHIIKYISEVGFPYVIVGNGSNLLVGDKGYHGIVLHLAGSFNDICVEGNTITAGAGALLSQTAKAAMEHALSGMEFAAGIPGTIGGALVMNAGAYGGEMKQLVRSVKVMDMTGEILEFDNETMEFGYRTSVMKGRPYIALQTVLELTEGDSSVIQAKMEELAAERRQKQPLEFPSAGSTFKRPEGRFAGKLIMDAGMRGYRIGGAQVAEKHCGFIVNRGNATAADIAELIEEVQERVKDRFDVMLEPEIVMLGDF